jgi:large subunit ribosomal protein L5
MSDNESKKDGGEGQQEKPAKAPKPPKPDGAERPEKAAKAEGAPPKGDKAEGAPKGEKPEKGGEKKGGDKGQAAKGDKGKGGGEKGKPKKEEVKIKRTAPPRLRTFYLNEVVPKLRQEFNYTNPNQVPKLVKITVNMGLGETITNPKVMDSALEELRAITGQSPVVTKAKKSIATFKLRQGMKIGAMVTLRREKMYEFFDRLVSLALPRVRDFKGISPKSFDGRGNFSLGIREQIIFPEINYDKIDKIKGLNISIVTTARTDDEGRALLKHMGMPFRQPGAAKE